MIVERMLAGKPIGETKYIGKHALHNHQLKRKKKILKITLKPS